MFRFFAILIGIILLLPQVSFSANPKDDYKSILAKLIPPTMSYSVKIEKNSLIKGFKQLNVTINDKNRGLIEHRYLWVSEDKSLIVPVLIKNTQFGFEKVSPKSKDKRIPTDISWFNNMLNKLPKEMKKSYGKGKNVYLLSDPYCPFCKIEIPKLKKLAKENKISLHIIPFDVHGKKADKASLLFIKIEKEKNLLEAMNEIQASQYGDIDKKVESNKTEIDKFEKKYLKFLKDISNTVYKHGIHGTPTIIIQTKNNKGYIISGVGDIQPYIK